MASIWETPNWAVTSVLTAATGYDSNLTQSHDGPADEYFQASPTFTLLRRNSSTDFHLNGTVTGTEFLHHRQPGQTDGQLAFGYAYPFAPDVVPLYNFTATWQSTAEPNPYFGHRIRHDRTEVSGDAYHALSGKIGVTGGLQAYVDHYLDPSLNQNQRWLGSVGVAYEKRPDLLGSLNLGFAEGVSRPNHDLGVPDVHSHEVDLTVRARGNLTPKITGTVYGGFGEVRYTGGYQNRYHLPIAGADLTWGIDPRRTVVLAAYSGADYAPDGEAVVTSRAFLSFTDVVIGHWQCIVRAGPTRTEFRREIRQSTDEAWEVGGEFAYVPSDQFRVSLGLSGMIHHSDVRDRQYDRTVVSLQSSYRF